MNKACKQCGEVKPLNAYRKYYNGGDGHYKVCSTCERINSRRKYLESKAERNEDEENELLTIYQLYDIQRANGLAPPSSKTRTSTLTALVNNQISKLASISYELNDWLTKDLSEYNPDQLDDIYTKLAAKYCPKIGIDQATYLPVYDETYRPTLIMILKRFDEREDEYYGNF